MRGLIRIVSLLTALTTLGVGWFSLRRAMELGRLYLHDRHHAKHGRLRRGATANERRQDVC